MQRMTRSAFVVLNVLLVVAIVLMPMQMLYAQQLDQQSLQSCHSDADMSGAAPGMLMDDGLDQSCHLDHHCCMAVSEMVCRVGVPDRHVFSYHDIPLLTLVRRHIKPPQALA